MLQGRPAWAEIDLDAIAHNVVQLRRLIGAKVQLLAVVKANAYGHGATPVAMTVAEAGADMLGVACADEGVQLRRAGIALPILVLDHVPPWQVDQVLANDLAVTVNTWQLALGLSQRATALGKKASVHIKVDSGLGRYGLLPHEAPEFGRRLAALPDLDISGCWTHFASADETDKEYTRRQLAVYQDAVRALGEAGVQVGRRHVANSAATIDLPETHLDMVRCGVAVYGLYPSTEVERKIKLRPAMSLKARVARVRELAAGSAVSYGRTFITDGQTRVALIPMGYADGFCRSFSNTASVLIRGKRVPVVGRVCMDQFVVNVQGLPGVAQEDQVVIMGRQGKECVSAEELAQAAGTINYEIVCGVSERVPRVYLSEGKAVAVSDMVDGFCWL